jgi:hypothetical protein
MQLEEAYGGVTFINKPEGYDRLEAQCHQGGFFEVLLSVELEELFQVVGALVEQCPDTGALESAIPRASKAAQVFGHGNKAFSGRTRTEADVFEVFIDIIASSHKDMVDEMVVELEVVLTSEAQIGEGQVGIALHTSLKQVQGWAIEGFVVWVADKILRGDHKALPIEGHLSRGAEFGCRMAFALFDGPGIEVIERDQAVFNMLLPGQFESGLLIEEVED